MLPPSPLQGKLVIFGCGYLGRELALRAREEGLEVYAVTRNPSTASRLRSLGISAVEARLEDDTWHKAIPSAPEFVVNCVAAADRTDEGYRQSYLGGMVSILDWAKDDPPGVCVYTSSTGVYGAVTGEVDEGTPTRPDTVRSRILRETETLLETSAAVSRWFILRLSGLYGPGRHQLLDRVLAGAPMEADEADRRMNLIHRDDAVGAILACLAAPAGVASQVFNVSGDNPAGRREMVTWLEEKTRALRAGRSLQCGQPEANPPRRREVPERLVSNRRLREVLGWRPRFPDFQTGYAAILRELERDAQNP